MSTDTDTRPQPPGTNETDDEYHHHAPNVKGLEDLDKPMRAYCGVVRYRKPNPLSYPCCPECSKWLKVPCVSEGWR